MPQSSSCRSAPASHSGVSDSSSVSAASVSSSSTGCTTRGESERAEAYSSYIAYCGKYRLEADVVVHTLRMSLFPNWVGGEQRRTAELSGDRLVLATPPTLVGEQVLVNRLYWVRAE